MSNDWVSGITYVGEPAFVDVRGDVRILVDADMYRRDRGIYERFAKPAIDRVLAIALLIFVSPVLLACAIAVYRSMGRPVILRQERVGLGGQIFTLYKFRTMDPDRRSASVPFTGLDRRISHKRADDPRLTDVGRFLRKWSLDELPQLFNVLKGDMSLVGPRPELVDIVMRYEPWQHRRHAVRPGITGLWQTSERGHRMMHEATDVDLNYITNLSAIKDIRILASTPLAALGRRTGF